MTTSSNEEAVQTAARAIYDELTPECVDDDGAYALAVTALAAAAPFVEARVRQQALLEAAAEVAKLDIRERSKRDVAAINYNIGIDDACDRLRELAAAARVVRGDQEAGK